MATNIPAFDSTRNYIIGEKVTYEDKVYVFIANTPASDTLDLNAVREVEDVAIVKLKNEDGKLIAPQTLEEAVFDENGVSLKSKLAGMNVNEITSKRAQALEDIQNAGQEQIDNINSVIDENVGLSDYPVFNSSRNYPVGYIVRYGGNLYKFISAHTAGVWTGRDAVRTTMYEDLSTKVNGVEADNKASTKVQTKSIEISEINFSNNLINSIILGNEPQRYKIMSGTTLVGSMTVVSDNGAKTLTQILQTHYKVIDGVLSTTTYDEAVIHTYIRTYNKASNSLVGYGVAMGNWSVWSEEGIIPGSVFLGFANPSTVPISISEMHRKFSVGGILSVHYFAQTPGTYLYFVSGGNTFAISNQGTYIISGVYDFVNRAITWSVSPMIKIVQGTGNSITDVMSQNSVTELINSLSDRVRKLELSNV